MKDLGERSVFFASKLIHQKMIQAARALRETEVVLDRLAEVGNTWAFGEVSSDRNAWMIENF